MALGPFEVIVVGAGAAGLAAGERLVSAGLGATILEARDRVGGRAHTWGDAGFPLDLGCGWLHSADRNPWTRIARDAGFTIDETRPLWGRQSHDLGFSAEDQAAFEEAHERFEARIAAVGPAEPDRAAAELLEPGGRWNGLLDAISTYVNGVELHKASVHDANLYADSGVNWRVVEGYGAAIAAFGKDLPVRLGCAVRVIDHAGSRLAVETSLGTISADAVIVTVPTSILASEKIRFHPELPDKVEAAAKLPLGVADKVVLAIDTPEMLPVDGHVFGRTDRAATGSYHLRPFGRPLVEGFFGGGLARDLENAGPDAFFAFAVDELSGLFGRDLAARLRPVTATRWALDPYALGSYSHALPGFTEARKVLAEPVEGRIFFAGEACSRHDFSTAHGAYATGIAAAEQVIARARRSPR